MLDFFSVLLLLLLWVEISRHTLNSGCRSRQHLRKLLVKNAQQLPHTRKLQPWERFNRLHRLHRVPLFQLLDNLKAVCLDVLSTAKFSNLGMNLKLVS